MPANRGFTALRLGAVLIAVFILSFTSWIGIRKIRESQALATAKEGVRSFHVALDHEVYHGIYEDASTQFRNSVPEDRYVQYLQTIHEQMGNSSDSQLLSAEAHTNPDGIFVVLRYNTKFVDGPGQEFGTEVFQWIVRDGQAKLYSFAFDSRHMRFERNRH